jgi:NAD(P)H-nitrite reductase large subunit
MQHYRYVIIGGGIAGTTAAETIRAHDPEGSIAIVSDEPHRLYSRVLLSKQAWLTGGQAFDRVWLKEEGWYVQQRIHLFRGIRATELDAATQRVTLSDGDTLQYEKLLLATGTHSRRWNVPGAQKEGVLYLRTVDEAKALRAVVQGAPTHVVMVGGSWVSFEIIDILLSRGFQVTEVLREKYFFERQFSQEEASIIERVLVEKGVEIVRESEVSEVLGDTQVTGVRLKTGRTISCTHVLAMIGIEHPIEWMQRAGVATHVGIYANEYLETNVPNIWTAGDTAESWDRALGETVIMGNWMSARFQGEVAGKNMSGQRVPFEQVSLHLSHGFGFTIGWIGDVSPGPDRIVTHYPTPEADTYCRIIVWQGRVIGGTTINRPDLMQAITTLIKKKTPVGHLQEGIATGSVDVRALAQQA